MYFWRHGALSVRPIPSSHEIIPGDGATGKKQQFRPRPSGFPYAESCHQRVKDMHILIVILMCVGVVMLLAIALLSVLRDLHDQAAPGGEADEKEPASRRTDINSHA